MYLLEDLEPQKKAKKSTDAKVFTVHPQWSSDG
jgi:hypothetical protein